MVIGSKMILLGLVTMSVFSCRARDEQMISLQKALSSTVVEPQKIGNAMVIGDADLTGNRNVEGGLPKFTQTSFVPRSDVYLSRKQFVIYYNVKAKIPSWTAWQVVDSDLGPQTRSNRFRSDEILNNFMRAKERLDGVSSDDYGGSCFDRGHQAASADRSNSLEDNEATYLMSNMSPQTAFLNKRIWADLEKYTRKLVEEEGRKIQVYAGPIMKDGREGIGPNKDIQVPDAFFKVIAIFPNNGATKPSDYIAVIMPNQTSNGLDPIANREVTCKEQLKGGTGRLSTNWEDYKVKLKDIETKAGVRFPALADLQNM
jgi:endonuclease G, mitochondrial